MDVRCGSCNKLFRVADERIAGKGIKFKCSKCGEIVTISKEDFDIHQEREAAKAELAAQAASPPQTAPPVQPAAPQAPQLTSSILEDLPSAPPQPPAMAAASAQPSEPEVKPPAAMVDFDFSEPHAAAQHPEGAFAPPDFSFDMAGDSDMHLEPEQGDAHEPQPDFSAFAEQNAPEPEPDLDLSAALTIPEPKAASAQRPAPQASPGPGSASPEFEAELDLAAALSLPPEREPRPSPAAAQTPKTVPTPPVFSPPEVRGPSVTGDLSEPEPEESMDLGKALAMPRDAEPETEPEQEPEPQVKSAPKPVKDRPVAEIAERQETVTPPLMKAASAAPNNALWIVIAGIAAAVVLAAAGFIAYTQLFEKADIPGKKEAVVARQAPKPAPQQYAAVIATEGLALVNATGSTDPATGDIVLTGTIQNTTDKPKSGWYLVAKVLDAKDTVVSEVRMANGQQLYSVRDYEILTRRGKNSNELKTKILQARNVSLQPNGTVPFELRVIDPPANCVNFTPVLQPLDQNRFDDLAKEFHALYVELGKRTEKMKASIRANDLSKAAVSYGQVLAVCASCHRKFRD